MSYAALQSQIVALTASLAEVNATAHEGVTGAAVTPALPPSLTPALTLILSRWVTSLSVCVFQERCPRAGVHYWPLFPTGMMEGNMPFELPCFHL